MEKDVSVKTWKKPCLAQVGATALNVTVKPLGDCCSNIVQEVDPVSIYMKEIRASILKGKVNCGDSDIGVEGVIVVATSPSGTHYVGVTNEDGKYSICVPSVNRNTCYSIEAYCCSSCAGDVCDDAECDCGCKSQTPRLK